jgi:hypothetical protein
MRKDDPGDKTSRNFRNPPAEHRFRKGVSGNPRGRPRVERVLVSTKVGGQPGVGFEDRIKSLAILEAYRPFTLPDGETIPIIQLIFRKVNVSAANGNTRAQQTALNVVIGAEADRRSAAAEILKANVAYKEHWTEVLAERARTGATGPEPLPHPDDVVINYRTGEVTIDGPVMEEQKLALDQLRFQWPELEQELIEINEQCASKPDDLGLRKQRNELRKIVDLVRADVGKHNLRRAFRTAPTKSTEGESRRRKRGHDIE